MATLRIETVENSDDGMILIELRSEAGEVIAASEPMYRTHDEAVSETSAILKRAWPTSNPFDEDPTIGV